MNRRAPTVMLRGIDRRARYLTGMDRRASYLTGGLAGLFNGLLQGMDRRERYLRGLGDDSTDFYGDIVNETPTFPNLPIGPTAPYSPGVVPDSDPLAFLFGPPASSPYTPIQNIPLPYGSVAAVNQSTGNLVAVPGIPGVGPTPSNVAPATAAAAKIPNVASPAGTIPYPGVVYSNPTAASLSGQLIPGVANGTLMLGGLAIFALSALGGKGRR